MTVYSWTGPSSFSSSEQSPTVSPGVDGQYCLTVTDGNGCQDTTCTTVTVDARVIREVLA